MFCTLLGAVDSGTSTEWLIGSATIAINDTFLLADKSYINFLSLIHGGESSIEQARLQCETARKSPKIGK